MIGDDGLSVDGWMVRGNGWIGWMTTGMNGG